MDFVLSLGRAWITLAPACHPGVQVCRGNTRGCSARRISSRADRNLDSTLGFYLQIAKTNRGSFSGGCVGKGQVVARK